MRLPGATYRLQLTPDFGFERARAVVAYLHDLGITDLYLSPILEARPGSTHGYDVTDPTRLRSELGGEDAFDALAAELRRRDMGLLVDIVPNHMAASEENPWWRDVLRHGPDSRFASFFDIDWDAPWAALEGRLLLPVLGDRYGRALESGELTLGTEDGEPVVRYYDRSFPLDPATVSTEGVAGSASTDRLDRILAEQAYQLAFWKAATEEINYRRFFDISDLAGVRVEGPEVFEATHERILRLVGEGTVTGLRIDHIDGLRDPIEYLRRLERRTAQAMGGEGGAYIVVEKILTGEETLPDDWPVCGTSGYDFLNALNAPFVDPEGWSALVEAYGRFTGRPTDFEDVVYRAKKQVVGELFAGEVRALQWALARLARGDRHARDQTGPELRRALVEVSVCLPVYRTYTSGFEVAERDRACIEGAVAEARRRNDAVDDSAYELVRRVLRLELPDGADEDRARAWLRFVLDWQQFTGPLMAKGLEDTALYRYLPLLSLNAVGGHPGAVEPSLEAFHHFNRARRVEWPGALSATSTHDSKRSEDVRARLNVLSELPDEWRERFTRWHGWNEAERHSVHGRVVPNANEEMLIYETMLGAWPLEEDAMPAFGERLAGYLVKAAREAKRHTSWTEPDEAHEQALVTFAETILERSEENHFLPDFLRFQKRIAFHGALNSLSQLVLKIAAPGVPDFYRGTELWDFSLVDPDNRRPVDFGERARLLEELRRRETEDRAALAAELLAGWPDGRIKLYVTYRGLGFRRDRAALSREGDYLPLHVAGGGPQPVCAFARRRGEDWAVAAVPRRTMGLVDAGEPPVGSEVWGDRALALPEAAPRQWRNVVTGEIVDGAEEGGTAVLALSEALRTLPVALLYAAPDPGA